MLSFLNKKSIYKYVVLYQKFELKTKLKLYYYWCNQTLIESTYFYCKRILLRNN